MKLFDAYGREIEPQELKAEQAAPTLAGIRNIYSLLHPSVGLTPQRLAGILREAEFGDPFLYLELAEEMEEKDLHYLAVLGTRKQTVAQLEPVVEAASTAAEDLRAAALVEETLGALDREAVFFDLLDAVGKGFAAMEILWNTAGRQWYPERIVWRDPRWFVFDWVSGTELLVRSLGGAEPPARGASSLSLPRVSGARGLPRALSRGIPEPDGRSHLEPRLSRWAQAWEGLQPLTARLWPYKFIVHVAKAKSGLPIRGGLARAAGWAYLFKNYALKDWVTFCELFGQPLRLGKYGPGATEQDRRALLQAVSNLGTDAAAIIPESMAIEFVDAGRAAGGAAYETLCAYLDAQVTKAVLGQTLTTELPKTGGSLAAARVHEAVRRDILAADARRLSDTLNRDLVRPLIDLNFGPQRRYPYISLGLPDDSDAKVFADIIAELADRGLRISQKTVLDKLGLPQAGPDEPVLHPRETIAERIQEGSGRAAASPATPAASKPRRLKA